MKTVQDIYTKYKIMPNLQLHQLRVAAVGRFIAEHFNVPVDVHSIVLAGLFHDMGNIIKSDLSYFPEFSEPEGVEYWEGVKKEYLEKYGEDHHAAIEVIAREIGLPPRVLELVDGIGYSNMKNILASSDHEQKIIEYADTRVGPYGVLSLEERLAEGRKRYLATRTSRPHYNTDDGFEGLRNAAFKLEQQVFEHASIRPDEANDDAIEPMLDELRSYQVDTER